MKKHLLQALLLLIFIPAQAQFHTLTIPQASPHVVETQKLGITDITIDYASPAVKGRDVWNEVVPFEGDPIAWRVGANMNTRIAFSTDVKVNGQLMPAGSYGLHMIPRREGKWEVLFAENDQMWGSYYLDTEKDVFARIEVEPGTSPFRENLSFEFFNRTDSTLDLTVQWAEKSIPISIEVDLNQTVIASFRSELLGINTYRWEAWNDAARWCLNRKTNLEEALEWANRSINGGYNGFSANKNLTNLGTKLNLLIALDQKDEVSDLVVDAISVIQDPVPAYYFGQDLLSSGNYEGAHKFHQALLERHADLWFVNLGASMAEYLSGHKAPAISRLQATYEKADDRVKGRLKGVLDQMQAGTFKM